ncbi:MucR family transcriptional regulator [Sphingorhabdus sp. EL138]|jgi:predicted transcriptional regulator|uniref:MucR family transcriptional regulator n=1 Tax=Sphingorhabdus sp. EL138 TaxID=2073156 RepID=UPI000D6930E7|nr:MucR family transcriptional regulator [Sphingorhabdus sp. EL138]
MNKDTDRDDMFISMTSNIVSAHVANNNMAVSDIPNFIEKIHSSLVGLANRDISEQMEEPAVPIVDSVKPSYIVCLEDGEKMKMLKRHLMTHHNLTPEEYKKKWGLPSDYPMVCSQYSAKRSDLAKRNGLGRARKKKMAA